MPKYLLKNTTSPPQYQLGRFFYALILAMFLFLMTMIDVRTERMGSCIVNGFTISPVSNLDCEGEFSSLAISP